MAIFVPAILTREADEVFEKVRFLETFPEITELQIDFEDGRFVENSTVLPKALTHLETRLDLDAHLMVANPPAYFHDLMMMNAKLLYLHFESFHKVTDLITAIRNAKAIDFHCGVALNPGTDLEVIKDIASEINGILLMSVYPGYQGQKFLPESLDRLQILRKEYPEMTLEIDGGINLDNFETIVAHGANRLVVGSGIWQTPNPEKTIRKFLRIL